MSAGKTAGNTSPLRTAILAKGDMLGIFSLAEFPGKIQLVTVDPREREPAVRHYDDPKVAHAVFDEKLKETVGNGWAVAYDGPPLMG